MILTLSVTSVLVANIFRTVLTLVTTWNRGLDYRNRAVELEGEKSEFLTPGPTPLKEKEDSIRKLAQEKGRLDESFYIALSLFHDVTK